MTGKLTVQFYVRAKLPYAIYLDHDSGGREIATRLEREGVPTSQVVKLQEEFPDRRGDFELEDIISSALYHRAVRAAHPDVVIDPPRVAADQKRTKAYEAAFDDGPKVEFSKRRVATCVKELVLKGEIDDESRTNLTKLAAAILTKLQGKS